MMQKQILIPDRVRRLPRSDWCWIDRRFLREFSTKLSGDAVFLYFLLIAVSDKNGLSYYSDNSLALKLRTGEQNVVAARDELLNFNLIAYQSPLVQVLSLTEPVIRRAKEPDTQLDIQALLQGLVQKTSVRNAE